MALQESEEVYDLYVQERRKEGTGRSGPKIVLTRHFAEGRTNATRRRLKRAAFLGVASFLCGVTAFVAVGIAHYIADGQSILVRSSNGATSGESAAYIVLGSVAGACTIVLTLLSRLERSRSAGGYLEECVEAARESIIVGLVLALVAFFWRPALIAQSDYSRGTILLFIPIMAVLLSAVRACIRAALLFLRSRGHNLASVVVIGDGPSAHSFINSLDEVGLGYRVIAHLTDIELEADLGGVLERLASEMPIDEVVIAPFTMAPDQLSKIVSQPGMRGARLRAVPEMFGLPPSKVQMQSFGDFPLLTLFENPVRGPHWTVKRALDIVGASFLLLLMGIPMLVMALLVRFTSEGPVLFRQERVGMDGKRFDVLKFRTMTAGASDQIHREFMTGMLSAKVTSDGDERGFFKLTDDPRITKVGRVLRRCSLDELPQLLNVLRGEMSLVGPRPALSYEVDLYEDWQRRRLDVLPGMTGLWQVSGRSRLSPADMLRLDVHYAETWSISTDLKIMLKTIPAILRDNAR